MCFFSDWQVLIKQDMREDLDGAIIAVVKKFYCVQQWNMKIIILP